MRDPKNTAKVLVQFAKDFSDAQPSVLSICGAAHNASDNAVSTAGSNQLS